MLPPKQFPVRAVNRPAPSPSLPAILKSVLKFFPGGGEGSSEGPRLLHEGDLRAFSSAATPLPRLVVDRGLLYGVSSDAVFSIDPATFEAPALVTGLDAEWFSGPRIAVGDDHFLYTLSGRNLVRIRKGARR